MLASLAFVLALQGKSPLDRMAEAMAGHRAVSFTMIGGLVGHSQTYRVRFLAPNLYSIVGGENESRSDGTRAWTVSPAEKGYSKRDLAEEVRKVGGIPGFGLVFPGAPKSYASGAPKNESFVGAPVVAVPVTDPPGTPGNDQFTVLLDPTTWLPRGMRVEREGKTVESYQVEDLVLDPPLTPADFAYTPPDAYRDLSASVSPGEDSRVGPPLAQIVAKPGAWAGGPGISELRLSPKVRRVGENWAFDIDAKAPGAYRWKTASASVLLDGKRRVATGVTFRPREKRVVVVVPRIGGKATPDVLFFEALRANGKAEYVFNFEFRPQPHP